MWLDKRFNSFDFYARNTFGRKLYKLTLAGGTTCPNRDGTLGTRGCIFCSEGGSGDFCPPGNLPMSEQVRLAKEKVVSKLPGDAGFIAYLQSYTATYLPIGDLEEKLLSLLSGEDILGISIGTRPDCLPPEVISLLNKVNSRKPVFVELGLQTVHETTAKFIRRGYELPVFEKAVRDLSEIGVNIVVHIIAYLPGETPEMMLDTVNYINGLKEKGYLIHGIKISLLHVLKGTDLADIYDNGSGFHIPEKEEYISSLVNLLEHLSPDIVVHRLTGDGPRNLLIAPLWTTDKKGVLNSINKRLRELDSYQGKEYKKNP